MHTFTGTEMLQIDIANCYGLDKEGWAERLLWARLNDDKLEELANNAEQQLMYTKAVFAYRDALEGNPIGHNMFLDATASGLQIMAALSGCKDTARRVNMIDTGEREDVYEHAVVDMNALLPRNEYVDRNMIKKPMMTHYYNKRKQDTLSELQQEAFYNVLANNFRGAEGVKYVINCMWDENALEHKWTLPDGYVAKVLVTEMAIARIEVDELNHTTFSYRFNSNQPSRIGTSLVPNVVHSIDAYIVREMIRRSDKAGFQLAHIFDSFTCHPNYMSQVMQFYREIMAEIAASDLLQNIVSEISGKPVKLMKYSADLDQDILQSQYMLS